MRAVAARLLAVVVAVGMVVGALAFRSRLEEADDGPVDGREQAGGQAERILCAADLVSVCDTIATALGGQPSTEPAGVTFDRLTSTGPAASAEADLDVWITTAPWPAMVDEARSRNGLPPLFSGVSPPVARSPLVLAVWGDRFTALDARCDPVTWACVGEVAPGTWADIGGQEGWGPVKPTHPAPDTSAIGLLVTGQAAASRLGTADFGSRQLETDEFRSWFRGLEAAVPSFPSSAEQVVDELLRFRGAAVDVVGVAEAQVAATPPDRRREVRVLYADPSMTVDVVLASTGTTSADALAQDLDAEALDALAAAGWRTGRAPPPALADAPPLTADATLPPAGALEALRDLWMRTLA